MGVNLKFRHIKIFKSITFPIFFIAIISVYSQSSKIIKGSVTDGKNPISEAIVKWQASSNSVLTDQDGRFELNYSDRCESNLITAWKQEFYNGGISYQENLKKIEIVLTHLPLKDNTAYKFIDPVPNYSDDINNCGDCHASIIYKQWSNNAHSKSASDPMFFDLYNGTNAAGDKNIQPGFKLDYQYSNGNCGNCHAPVAAINNFNNVDMNNLKGVEKLGVSCDFCHKIKDVKMNPNFSAYTGVMNFEILRPPENHQTFFGPFIDALNPNIHSEKFSQSVFCAPCHRGGSWGVLIYDSYDQWLKSSYAKEGIDCQDCHMTPDGVTTNIAPRKNGAERNPNEIFSHMQFGSRDSSFLASAVKMSIKSVIKKNKISVDVEIKNIGAGHHIPTDQPMRNMILLVRAFDSDGNELKYQGDNVIPFWGGRGDVKDGNYEGFAGKGFAKILFEDWTEYERLRTGVKSEQIYPAPQWRTVQIKSDTRIPALETDKSNYEFVLNKSNETYMVICKLIYRRTFKTWTQMKKWNFKDIILTEKTIMIKK